MPNLFFLVSGEHPSLPFSELEAILQAEKHRYKVVEKLSQVIRLHANQHAVDAVAERAALTRTCCLELFACNANYADIIRNVSNAAFQDHLTEKDSFVVRVHRVTLSAPQTPTVKLERKIGELVLRQVKAKVNLEKPEKTFYGVLTDRSFVFGLKIAETSPKPFTARRPKKKPFFHPSALPPKLARVMVNLAQPRASDLVFDPFCGTASILIEAGLIGCRTVGCDVKKRMAKGSLRNMRYYSLNPEGILVADSRKPPVNSADCAATDPPYGRATTTLGSTTEQLIKDALRELQTIIPSRRRVCMAAPKSLKIRELAANTSFKHVESHMVYIHRSLTREIAVFEATP